MRRRGRRVAQVYTGRAGMQWRWRGQRRPHSARTARMGGGGRLRRRRGAADRLPRHAVRQPGAQGPERRAWSAAGARALAQSAAAPPSKGNQDSKRACDAGHDTRGEWVAPGQRDRQRRAHHAAGRAALAARRCAARAGGSLGTHIGCGYGAVGVYHAARRRADTLAPAVRRPGGGARHHHRRGPGTQERRGPLQRAFRKEHDLQCDYCAPGFLITAHSLLLPTHHPTRAEIREALARNLCRCADYPFIVNAIEHAAAEMWRRCGPRARALRPNVCSPAPTKSRTPLRQAVWRRFCE